MMKKCDFCIASMPDGTCYWENLRGSQENECKKAIKKMTKALKDNNKKKNRKRSRRF